MKPKAETSTGLMTTRGHWSEKRPDTAFAHYSLAYVLRYIGRLDEAQSECEKAWVIDANDSSHTCALAFAARPGKPRMQ